MTVDNDGTSQKTTTSKVPWKVMSKSHCVAVLLVGISTLVSNPASAALADKLERLVGYTIIASKTVEAWAEDKKKSDGFEGCSHGRVIIFTDGTALTCNTYSYSYSYRPTAVILAKKIGASYDFKMVVDNDVYDMESR